MDRLQLLPLELPSTSNINNTSIKTKLSFMQRLVLGFIILAILGLLYIPAYHSAQGTLLGIGETSSSIVPSAQLSGWAYNKSRDLCAYIHPKNVTSILNPVSICSSSPNILIVICSSITNKNSRAAIRNTWANKDSLDTLYNSTVKIAFLLGLSDNETLNEEVVKENSEYNDIIQESFYDTYNNLTLKSVMMLKWVTANCNQVKYIMKTDDDMFVNVPNLVKTLQSRSPTTGTLLGSLICNAKPISDPKNKWYTPKYMYSGRTYPNYLSGTGYVMSIDVARKLYQAALATPLLHLEDVYITGLCAKKAEVRPINHNGFSYLPRKLEPCVLSEIITAHKVSISNMYAIWEKLNVPNLPCNYQIHTERRMAILNKRSGRNIGYYTSRKKNVNKCT
ncbi:beta-1,3-galactosyltransferase 1-like isoform X2 [Prorops nasuta]|uniref:beta-1,3-galactosyltransferase 1-like isoform X2 n=1 Tax=Prorops nasuta TaxID=863751 RepID=UPI0034CE50CE